MKGRKWAGLVIFSLLLISLFVCVLKSTSKQKYLEIKPETFGVDWRVSTTEVTLLTAYWHLENLSESKWRVDLDFLTRPHEYVDIFALEDRKWVRNIPRMREAPPRKSFVELAPGERVVVIGMLPDNQAFHTWGNNDDLLAYEISLSQFPGMAPCKFGTRGEDVIYPLPED